MTEIKKAKKLIAPIIRETPLEYSRHFSNAVEAEVYLKLENLQLTRAYKVRGAITAMYSLSEEERARGVVTASSGNHAQGIGLAARELNVHATIYVPENTPQTQIDAIQSHGVDLRVKGKFFHDAERLAHKFEKKYQKIFISSYNDPKVIAGAGTIGLEMMRQNRKIDTIIIPIGGGGLFSGISIAAKAMNPNITLYGAQSEASPVMHESLTQGRIVEVTMQDSIAKGLHGSVEQGSITFQYVQKYCEEILLVPEQEIKKAILTFLKHHHQLCEGAAAVGLATLLKNPERFKGHVVGVIISGGNLDYDQLRELMCT